MITPDPDPPGSRPLTIVAGAQMYRRAFRAGYAYANWETLTNCDPATRPDTINPFDTCDEGERMITGDQVAADLGDALLVRSPSGRVAVAIYPGPDQTRAQVREELGSMIKALIDFHNGEVLNP